MLTRFQFWTLSLLAVAALVLVAVNMLLITQSRQAQLELSARTQYIQQTAQLEPLYREMVRVLSEMATRNNDTALRDMLSKNGIATTAPAASSAAPEAGPAPASSASAPARKEGK